MYTFRYFNSEMNKINTFYFSLKFYGKIYNYCTLKGGEDKENRKIYGILFL